MTQTAISMKSWQARQRPGTGLRFERLGNLRETAMTVLGLGISLSILVVVIRGLGSAEIRAVLATAPRSPLFWLTFAATYLLGPAAEWAIFRRFWPLGPAAILPLLRKQVANEIVLGYSGDAQFYLWARKHAGVEGSVFGILRDVAILSALAGNLATLLMMAGTAPLLYGIATGPILKALIASVAVIVVTSLAIFAVQRKLSLLTMSKRDLFATFGIHSVRIALCLFLTAMMMHLLVPTVSVTMLVVVATLQMMVGRLPLLPARDALLAGLCMVLLGASSGVTAAMTLIATLLVAAHLIVGLISMLGAFVRAPAPAA